VGITPPDKKRERAVKAAKKTPEERGVLKKNVTLAPKIPITRLIRPLDIKTLKFKIKMLNDTARAKNKIFMAIKRKK